MSPGMADIRNRGLSLRAMYDPVSRPTPASSPRLCPYDPAAMATCPFNQPVSPARWHRSSVHCRHLRVTATPGGIIAVCDRVDNTVAP